MPYKSAKQRRYFHTNIDKIGKKVVEEFDKAENYYERLVEAEPNNIENSVNLAKVYLN